MATIPEALTAALQHHQAGRLQEAEAMYRQILQAQPDHADALHLLGVIAHQVGQHQAALDFISRAITLNPAVAEFHNNLGEACRALGKLDEAVASYRRALSFKPGYPDAHNNLGIALQAQGKFEDAVAAYREALTHNPAFAEAYANWGATLQEQGKHEEAVLHYRKAISLKPTYAEAYFNLGKVLQEQGKLDEAMAHYRQALKLKPAYVKAYNNLGNALHELGNPEEAIAAYRQALGHDPTFAVAYANLGAVLQEQSKLQEAEEAYRQAVTLNPKNADAYSSLGFVLKEQGKMDEAVEVYRQALAFEPNAGTRIKLATMLPVILGSKQDVATIRKQFEKAIAALSKERLTINDPIREVGQTNFYLAYHGRSDRGLQVKVAKLYECACPSLLYTAQHCLPWPKRRTRDKIKIGFISRYLRNHSIGKIACGLIANLSREKFRVCAVFVPPVARDDISTFIQQHADQSVFLPNSLQLARERIAAEEFDILFYQDIGMEPVTYFLAFSRLAPVQCVSFGHPVTTGIRSVDYFISTEGFEPASGDEHYSEKLIRLKSLIAYYYKPTVPRVFKPRSKFGLNDTDRIYICPQTQFKFHPDFDEILKSILDADPQARVVMKDNKVANWTELLLRRFKRSLGRHAERVTVLPWQPGDDFINLIAIADVMLDTFHFGGYTTNLEAFAVGTPVVTWPGEFQRGRHTLALYKKMGLMDCVADTPARFIEIAVRLGTDEKYRARIKAKILKQNHVLYEDFRVVKEYERVFLKMVEDARQSHR